MLDAIFIVFCGERGIRTPGPVKINGFQDRRIRPLCQLSNMFPQLGFVRFANSSLSKGIAKIRIKSKSANFLTEILQQIVIFHKITVQQPLLLLQRTYSGREEDRSHRM